MKIHQLNCLEEEKEYVRAILDQHVKVCDNVVKGFKYNKWTDSLCQSIITGDFHGFIRRLKMATICLKRRKPVRYLKMSDKEMMQLLALRILNRFFCPEQQTTILMVLFANCNPKLTCSSRDHGYCRIAHALLKYLDRNTVSWLLSMRTKEHGKTVLHFSVSTGDYCQLRLLLTLADINPNVFDSFGKAAIHYAIERNDLLMVRMLMWYGADPLLSNPVSPNQAAIREDLYGMANAAHWRDERMYAISYKMNSIIRQLCGRFIILKHDLCPVHFVRVFADFNCELECQLNMTAKDTITQHFNNKKRVILFIIPIVFSATDEYASAADPKITHVNFPENTFISGRPILDHQPDGTAQQLSPVFNHSHNSAIYAFDVPYMVQGMHRLSFQLKNSGDFHRNAILAVQIYSCTELETRSKSKLD